MQWKPALEVARTWQGLNGIKSIQEFLSFPSKVSKILLISVVQDHPKNCG